MPGRNRPGDRPAPSSRESSTHSTNDSLADSTPERPTHSAREWLTHSTDDTIRIGKEIGSQLKPPALVLLRGELGAGKTTLTKGIVSGLGAAREEDVTSPTFTLIHNYRNGEVDFPSATETSSVRVFHIDLYRVGNFRDFETLGIEDLFAEPAVVIIEWPEKMGLRTGWPLVEIDLDHVDETTRRIRLRQP